MTQGGNARSPALGVLIDAENVSARYADALFDDITRFLGLDADVHRLAERLRCARRGAQKTLLYRYYRGGMHGPGKHAYQ